MENLKMFSVDNMPEDCHESYRWATESNYEGEIILSDSAPNAESYTLNGRFTKLPQKVVGVSPEGYLILTPAFRELSQEQLGELYASQHPSE